MHSLRRTLSLWQLVAIGLIVVQPIAPMGVYGIVSNRAGGHVITTILVAMVAMLFTAVSYGKMARAYPSAGSAYVYVGQELHPALGYVTGWAMVMEYILNPIVCTVICSKLAANVVPGVPYWALATCFAASFTAANLLGIRTSARVSEVLAAAMLIVVAIFLVAVVRSLWGTQVALAAPFYDAATFSRDRLFSGTSIAVLTYVGFDAVSTLSEEAEHPQRDIMRATVLVCLFTGILSSIEVYAAQLAWGSKPFPDEMVESAFPLVARQAGGAILFHLLNVTVLVANVGSGIGSQLGAARLLYGMGRHDGIPRRFFGALDPKRRVPRNNVLFVGALVLAGSFLMNYERGAELLNFGAFIAFMGVNVAALVRCWIRADRRSWADLFGPAIGFSICLLIWTSLSPAAKAIGGAWLLFGLLYGLARTRGFRPELVRFDVPEAD